jgi:hypothetical protein
MSEKEFLHMPLADSLRSVRGRYVLSAGILVLLALVILWPYRHFAGDDAYITFRFAENFATGAGFAYNPNEPTYGSTAPLWVFMIVGLSRLGLAIPDSAHVLNWTFAIASVLLFFHLARRYLGKGPAAWIATALLILDPWFVRWALSGLENAFALFLLMGVFLAQLKWRNTGQISWLAPVLGGLAALCRPEMMLLSALLFLDLLLFERRRLRANLATLVLIFSAINLPWIWYALSVFHTAVPNTIISKVSADHLAALKGVVLYFGSFWMFQALAVLAVCLIGPLRRAAIERFQGSWTAWLLPIAWGVILPIFYIVGGAPVGGRYMMFGLPSYLLIGVAAWTVLWDRMSKVVVVAALATLALLVAVQYNFAWYITHWPQGMDPEIINAAETLRSISESGDTVAANQIGVLGYFSQRTVLDTFGLVSPEIFPYRRISNEAVWKYVHERRVQYVFDTISAEELARLDPAYASLTLIRPYSVQRENAGSADKVTTYYLYKTNW